MRRLLLALVVTAAAGVLLGAQRVTQDNLPSHVVVDSCSGCGGAGVVGQATMAASAPVVIASDQSAVHTVCDSGCGSPPATPDNAAFTASVTSVSITAGVYNDALSALSAGVSAAFRITASRALHVNLRNASGTEISPLTDTQLRASAVPVSQSGTWTVQPGNTQNTTPWLATYIGAINAVDGAAAGYAVNSAGSSILPTAATYVFNGSNWDRRRTVVNGQDSTGTGIAAAGILGQFDDVSTGAVTENNFAPVRLSSRRALLVEGVASGTALKVDGSAVTQPVSLASVPAHDVTNAGTFAVQVTSAPTTAVTGPLTDTQLRASAVPVSGPLTDTQLRATAVPVSGTVTASGPVTDTQLRASAVPVSLASAPTTAVTNAGLTNLDVALSTRLKPADTLTGVTTVGTVTTITNAVTVAQATAANLNATVTQATLTKGTQGSTGVTTQDLKDAGRTSVMITATVASTATSETLITLTRSVGLASTGTCTSCGITTGKRLRIQAITIAARNSTGTVASNVTVNLRAAVGGATSASSPLQAHWMVALPASTVTTLFPTTLIPDGFEIDANGATNTYGITITHPQWSTGTQVATFDLTIVAYEY